MSAALGTDRGGPRPFRGGAKQPRRVLLKTVATTRTKQRHDAKGGFLTLETNRQTSKTRQMHTTAAITHLYPHNVWLVEPVIA